MKRICVFCGSSSGTAGAYTEAAVALGKLLARRGIGLVYGGASVGLMGAIADAALADGGEVIGVIPQDLVEKEVAHGGLTELKVVGSMHERKALMEKLSDGFIAMPGGFGTMDEFCEIVTWMQLGIHHKPCGLLNVANYYDTFIRFVGHAVSQGFLRAEHWALVYESADPAKLLELFNGHLPPAPTAKRRPGAAPKP